MGMVGALLLAACAGGEGTDEPFAAEEDDGAPSSDEEIDLTYASAIVSGATSDQLENWLFEEVEARTDGRVTVEQFNDNSLVTAFETLPAIQDGRADAGFWMHPYNPYEAPLFEVAGLPFQTDSEYAIAWTLWEMYQEDELFREDLHAIDMRPIFFGFSPSAVTMTTEPTETLADLAGLRLRVVGDVAEAFRDIGVEPVAADPLEVYESIQRGVLDGSGVWVMEAAAANAIYEVAPHITHSGVGVYTGWGFWMNNSTWESLPPEVQETFDEVTEELIYETGPELYVEGAAESCEQFLDAGGTVTLIAEDEVEAWSDRVLDGLVDRWVDEVVTRKGMSEDEVRAWRDAFLERLEANTELAESKGLVPDLVACHEQYLARQ